MICYHVYENNGSNKRADVTFFWTHGILACACYGGDFFDPPEDADKDGLLILKCAKKEDVERILKEKFETKYVYELK